MLHIFATAFHAIMPICLIIALGYWLKTIGFLSEEFGKKGNSLMFRYLLPVMLFCNVYKVEGLTDISWSIVLFSVLSVLAAYAIGCLLAPQLTKDDKQKGVLLQATFRGNSALIGIPLAEALGGTAGVAVASYVCAFTVPMFNILAVIALSKYIGKDGKKTRIKDLVKAIVTNPLIIGIALAFAALIIRAMEIHFFGSVVFSLQTDLKFLYSALTQLAAAACPLALLMLGTQFSFRAAGDLKKMITAGVLLRLVLVPVLVIAIAVILVFRGVFRFGVNEFPTLVATFATPCAVSSSVMASAMDNDGQLAAQLVVWTSMLSIVTIFLFVVALMSMGLLTV